MTSRPFISIVIPTFNRPLQLAACLEACAKLDYPSERYEVIVVDDGGSVPLDCVLSRFHHAMRLTLLKQENTGPAAARNLGVSQAAGELVAFTDDDCAPSPGWLRALAEQSSAYPGCAVGGRTINALPHNVYSTASQTLISYLFIYYNSVPDRARFFPSNNLAFPAKQFRAIGGFDVTYPRAAAEDRELCDRWLHLGFRMVYAPEAVVYHAHTLSLRTFWKQHFGYGKGAFRFHQLRARRGQHRIKVEPPAFYVNMLRYPFATEQGVRAPVLMWLLVVAQMANAMGFFRERLWEKGTMAPRSCARAARKPCATRAYLRNILVAVGVAFITCIALEGAVRLWGYAQPHIYDPIYTPFTRAGEIPYVHKSDLVQARGRGLAVINTDNLGLRTKTAGSRDGVKQPNEYRIAVVGDSCTFGEGVQRTEDTFAQVLDDSLNRQQQAVTVKVFNYGASAYSVKEMAATLQHRMIDIEPDLVVMAIIPADFDLDRTPTIDEAGYLIDKRLSHLGPSGSMTRQMLRGIHATYVLRDLGLQWFFKPADITDLLSRGEIPDSYRYVRQFKELAEQHGLPYLIVLLPLRQGKSWGPLPDRLASDRIRYADLSFLGSEFSVGQYRASRFDPHPSAAVHHRIGETLADFVQRSLRKV